MTFFPEAVAADLADFIDIGNNRTLLKYFQQVQRHFIYSNNFGLALDDEAHATTGKPVLLEKLFVAPNLTMQHITPERLMRAEKRQQETEQQGVSTVLKQHQWAFILGDPGTGKSTLVAWLMLSFTSVAENRLTLALGSLVPFAVILRELNLRDLNSWGDLCQRAIAHNHKTLTAPFSDDPATFQKLLEKGQLLFLLDGLDEITQPQRRQQLAAVLLQGMQQYPACRFIITSRLVGFNQAEWFGFRAKQTKPTSEKNQKEDKKKLLGADLLKAEMEQGLPAIYLSPFNYQQVKCFIRHWYEQYVTLAEGRRQLADDLQQRLNRHDGLSHLSRIPVLLNMICFIHSRRGRLPDGRAELYQRIAETYLTGLDRARKIRFKGKTLRVDYIDLSEWLSGLALMMQERRTEANDAILIAESEVKAFFAEKLEENEIDEIQLQQEVAHIIDYIGHRSGIFIPRGKAENNEEHYAFTHLSFLEYFAAKGMKAEAQFWSNKDWESYRQKTQQVWWHEVFSLFFEQLDRRQTEVYLEWLFGSINGRMVAIQGGLLAAIMVDTSVRLLTKKRKKWIQRLWYYYLQQQAQAKNYLLDTDLAEIANTLWTPHFDAIEIFQIEAKNYKMIKLHGNNIDDISPLSKLTNINYLSLSQTRVSDLKPLKTLVHLEALYLGQTQVCDLSPLSALVKLQNIHIDRTPVNDLTPLTSLINLRKLYSYRTNVSDLKPLMSLTKLERLYLGQTQVNDLTPLRFLTSLQRLYLDGTKIRTITTLIYLTKLKVLGLHRTQVNNLAPITKLVNLQKLSLHATQVKNLLPLASLINVQELYLDKKHNLDLTPLASIKNLEIIEV